MNFGNAIDRIVKKHWTDEEIKKYVGDYQYAALTYANDKDLRQSAASGGAISSILIEGISAGHWDAAVVCNTIIQNGHVRTKFTIAKTKEEILRSQGSKYVETNFLAEVIPLINNFNGRVAVVGLPCDISGLKRRAEKRIDLSEKIALTIVLVCGHNSRKELIDKITSNMESAHSSKIIDYKFRVGHWRGKIEAAFENGERHQYKTALFNDYQNLFFFCERKCLACFDHFGYQADISVGDVWLYKLKNDSVKYSGLIIRTDKGKSIFEHMINNQILSSKPLDIRVILDGQSRIAPSHYNVSARHIAGKQLGIKLKDTVKESVKWHQKINAYITLINIRLSESSTGQRIIFKIPRLFIKIYLYLKKGLETLK